MKLYNPGCTIPGIFLCLLLLSGCLKEEPEDCGKYIWFEVINPKYSFPESTTSLILLVYDNNGNIADRHTYSKSDLQAAGNGKGVFVPIPHAGAGQTYTIVGGFNIIDRFYNVTGIGNLETLEREIVTVRDSIKHYFSGTAYARKDVVFDRHRHTRDTMLVTKDSNYINLYLTLLNYNLPAASSVTAVLRGINGDFDQWDKSLHEREIVYLPYQTNEQTNGGAIEEAIKLKTDRIWIGDDLHLVIEQHDGNGAIDILKEFEITNNIIAMITDSSGNYLYDTDEKLEYEDVFDINVIMQYEGGKWTVVSLTVNDWMLVSQQIDM